MFFVIEADDFLYSINKNYTCLKQIRIYILFLLYYDISAFSVCVRVHIYIFCKFLCVRLYKVRFIVLLWLKYYNSYFIVFLFVNILLFLFICQYFLSQSPFYCAQHLCFNHFCSGFIIIIMMFSSQKESLPSLYFIPALILLYKIPHTFHLALRFSYTYTFFAIFA